MTITKIIQDRDGSVAVFSANGTEGFVEVAAIVVGPCHWRVTAGTRGLKPTSVEYANRADAAAAAATALRVKVGRTSSVGGEWT